MEIKLLAFSSEEYKEIFDDLFITTIPESLKKELTVTHLDYSGVAGLTSNAAFKKMSFQKMESIHNGIKSNIGDVFIWTDTDIVFFRDFKEDILTRIVDYDILLMGDTVGFYCAGFMVFRCSEKVLAFWELVMENYNENNHEKYGYDQAAINALIVKSDLIHACLPKQYHFNPIWCNPDNPDDVTNTINAIPNDAFLSHFQAVENGWRNKYKIMSETIKRYGKNQV